MTLGCTRVFYITVCENFSPGNIEQDDARASWP